VALLLLGLLTFVMGWGAAFGGSRPAALALIAIGIVVLGITLLGDLPASDDTGADRPRLRPGDCERRGGLWFELIAGILAVLAGLMRVIRPDD
jgi:hypothetical protein